MGLELGGIKFIKSTMASQSQTATLGLLPQGRRPLSGSKTASAASRSNPVRAEDSPIATEQRQPSRLVGFLGEHQEQWTFKFVNPDEEKDEGALAPPEPMESKEADSPEEREASPVTEKVQFCCNQYCGESQGLRRVREAKSRSMCKICAANYIKGQFCEYCEQVYSVHHEHVDGKLWICCDSCARWNHTDCELRSGNLKASSINSSVKHFCQRCEHTRKQPARRPTRSHIDQNFLYQNVVRKRPCHERPRLDRNLERSSIFEVGRSLNENFMHVEGLLASFGCRLSFHQDQLESDLKRVHQLAVMVQESRNEESSSQRTDRSSCPPEKQGMKPRR